MVIDATILKAGGGYYLIFKDERLHPLRKQMLLAGGPTPEGPWTGIGGPFTEPWSEGPSALRVGEDYIVYYDHYRDPRGYRAVRSRDLNQWTDVTSKMSFPSGAKHGCFLEITAEEAGRLRK